MTAAKTYIQLFRGVFDTRRRGITAGVFASLILASAALPALFQPAPQAAPRMAAMLPQGALLTLEAKDFAGLLTEWSDSPQKSAWVKSDNYAVFSRSRLFGRLGDAQKEFAQAAGLPEGKLGTDFLRQVAGTSSIFAWYDIGKLEFLYITRMPPGAAEQNPLMQMRDKFSARQAAGKTFYVRNQAEQNGGENPVGEPRTVAFATSGDWLLLATREDLMAGALTLMASRSGQSASGVTSVAAEPWFVDAAGAAAKEPGALRMTLNLEKIVPSPYFRSYWIQQNITEMKQYRSAVCDLYTESGEFREERALVRKSAPDDAGSAPTLAPLVALLPQRYGVYRAQVAPGVETALASLNERLLQRSPGSVADRTLAPEADLEVHEAGSASDLETRIDAPALALPVRGSELVPLREALGGAGMEAMLTVSRTGPAAEGIWVPFESAVVLSAARDWDAGAMQSALQAALGARLTAGGLGLAWKPVKSRGGMYFEIGEARRLEMAIRGKLLLLADDPSLMLEMLDKMDRAGGRERKPAKKQEEKSGEANADLVAGFDLTQERAHFARWSSLVDRTGAKSGTADDDGEPNGSEPSFFSGNMRSLGDSFAALGSERMVERGDGNLVRQTVTYVWTK